MRILVAYSTCHGSTAEIARRIASRLESSGDAVECRAMSEVSHLSGYEAVVAGSALHDQDWLAEARAFMSRFAPDLDALPVWLFSVGMPAALPSRLQGWAMQEEDQVAAKLSSLIRPRGHRLFSGVVRREHLTPGGRAKFRLMGGRYGDFRNWEEIDSWASAVADELHRAVQALVQVNADGEHVAAVSQPAQDDAVQTVQRATPPEHAMAGLCVVVGHQVSGSGPRPDAEPMAKPGRARDDPDLGVGPDVVHIAGLLPPTGDHPELVAVEPAGDRH